MLHSYKIARRLIYVCSTALLVACGGSDDADDGDSPGGDSNTGPSNCANLTDAVAGGWDDASNNITDINNIRVNDCEIDYFAVRYSIDSFIGSATQRYGIKWTAADGTAANCLPYDLKVQLKIVNPTQPNAFTNNLQCLIPESGDAEWSYDTTGSPSWGDFFQDGEMNFYSAEDARAIFDSATAVTLGKICIPEP